MSGSTMTRRHVFLVLLAASLLAACSEQVPAQGGQNVRTREYALVYDVYKLSLEKHPDAFQDLLDYNRDEGVFDEQFYGCLNMLERAWNAGSESHMATCGAYPLGSLEKIACASENVPGKLAVWSRDLRVSLSGQAAWGRTDSGREAALRALLCAQTPALCDAIAGGVAKMTPKILRPRLVCHL